MIAKVVGHVRPSSHFARSKQCPQHTKIKHVLPTKQVKLQPQTCSHCAYRQSPCGMRIPITCLIWPLGGSFWVIDPSLHCHGCFWVGRHLAQTDYQALSCKFRDESKLISRRIAAAAERSFAQDSIGTLLKWAFSRIISKMQAAAPQAKICR